MMITRGAQISQKSRCHLKILGDNRMTRTKLHTNDPQISGATVSNWVGCKACSPGFVHPWQLHSIPYQNTTHNAAPYCPDYMIMQLILVFKDKNVYQGTEGTACQVGWVPEALHQTAVDAAVVIDDSNWPLFRSHIPLWAKSWARGWGHINIPELLRCIILHFC
jgi:hypothetical protein